MLEGVQRLVVLQGMQKRLGNLEISKQADEVGLGKSNVNQAGAG